MTVTLAANDAANNLIELFKDVPLASKLPILLGFLVPGVSAYLTRRPSFITGMATVLLATAAAVVSNWLANGTDFDWGAALSTAFATLAVAWGAQSKLYKDTPVVKWLHGHGLVQGEDLPELDDVLPPTEPNWNGLDPDDDSERPVDPEPEAAENPYDGEQDAIVPDAGYDPKHD